MADWTDSAICRPLDTRIFFPPERQPGVPARAAAICARCPVSDKCLRFGVTTSEYGVWGGVRLDDTVHTAPNRPLPPMAAVTSIVIILHRAVGTRRYSAPEIATMLGIERQTARANLHALERHGIVDRHPQNNPRPDLYELAHDVDLAATLHAVAAWPNTKQPLPLVEHADAQLTLPGFASVHQIARPRRRCGPECPCRRCRPPIAEPEQSTIYDQELSA